MFPTQTISMGKVTLSKIINYKNKYNSDVKRANLNSLPHPCVIIEVLTDVSVNSFADVEMDLRFIIPSPLEEESMSFS